MPGFVKASGALSISVKAASVARNVRPFLTMKPRSRSVSMIPALVASVPIPTVSRSFELPIRVLVERTDPYVADPLSVHIAFPAKCVWLRF